MICACLCGCRRPLIGTGIVREMMWGPILVPYRLPFRVCPPCAEEIDETDGLSLDEVLVWNAT